MMAQARGFLRFGAIIRLDGGLIRLQGSNTGKVASFQQKDPKKYSIRSSTCHDCLTSFSTLQRCHTFAIVQEVQITRGVIVSRNWQYTKRSKTTVSAQRRDN